MTFLALLLSHCWVAVLAQPAEVHLGFYFPMFPLYPVSDQDFKANLKGKQSDLNVLPNDSNLCYERDSSTAGGHHGH